MPPRPSVRPSVQAASGAAEPAAAGGREREVTVLQFHSLYQNTGKKGERGGKKVPRSDPNHSQVSAQLHHHRRRRRRRRQVSLSKWRG